MVIGGGERERRPALSTLLWIALAFVSLLWPARLAGMLDGAPLDSAADALLIGLLLPALLAINVRALRRRTVRAVIVGLLLWKTGLALWAAPDGWCLRYTSPVPIFLDNLRVPHAWDVRADWRSDRPRCSAVMTRAYFSTTEFPAWFFNLPPANLEQPADETERPPYATVAVDVSGYLQVRASGEFTVESSDDVTLAASIDGVAIASTELTGGVPLEAGVHEIRLSGTIGGESWRLVPRWNGRVMFGSATALMEPPGWFDYWLRPWGKWATAALVLALVLGLAVDLIGRVAAPQLAATALIEMLLVISTLGRPMAMRMVPMVFGVAATLKLPRRFQNILGAQLLMGLPFLALIAVRGIEMVGRTTWYTIGDDWWVFQRFAYRIYLQGHWLEGGEPTFWFQPFYRWIAGALHMTFGDSSVGELFWDGACAWAGALFAFYVTKRTAGFRWGALAATVTLVLFTLGPAWYLFGRGLSEITSAGLVYAAALLVIRGRRADAWPLIAAAFCIAIAFYTRLNNVMFAAGVAACSLPMNTRAGDWWRWRSWWPRVSKPALTAVVAAVIAAVVLFGLRTYYYTGQLDPLAGTQAGARSIWQTSAEGYTPRQNLTRSVLLVMTMSDPPRWEPRAIPIFAGLVTAMLALAGVPRFRELPLSVVAVGIAGMAGAFVAQGSSYPGRFSVHLLPVTVALMISAIALLVSGGEAKR